MTNQPTTVFQAGALAVEGIRSVFHDNGHDPQNACVVDHGHYLMCCRCCGDYAEWTVRITDKGMEATIIADTVSDHRCPGRRHSK